MTTAEVQPRRRLASGDKLGPLARHVTLALERKASGGDGVEQADSDSQGVRNVPGLDVEARTLELTFSSEAPVPRWFGDEVLSHAKGAADLSRLNDGAPLLFNHDLDDIIGVVEKAWIDASDKRGHAIVRFANTPRADEIFGMVQDGILRNVSFMYTVDAYVSDSDPDGDDDATYTATAWRCYEISMVTVPADQSIGVGRAAGIEPRAVEVVASRAAPSPAPADPSLPSASTQGDSAMIVSRTRGAAALLMTAAVAGLAADAGAAGGGTAVRAAEPGAAAAPAAAAPAAGVSSVADERQRVADVVAICRKHNLGLEKAHDFIARGLGVEQVRGLILDSYLGEGAQQPVASLRDAAGNLDLTPKEQKRYSLIRAVSAIVNGGDWTKAGFERECSREIAKRMGKETSGFYMPTSLPFAPDEEHLRAWRMQGGDRNQQVRAPYLVGTAAQGGNLVATNLLADNFIEVLRNASVTAQLGARYLTDLTGKVDIPRQSAALSATWVGESTAPAEGEATFDKVSLAPKTVAAWSQMSRLMLLQATPAIEMLAREDLLAVAALAVDLAALSGSGAGGQPLGIVNQSGVSSVVGGTNGANLTLDNIIQLKTAPKVANAQLANLAFALNYKSVGYLETLKSSTGAYLWSNNGSAAQGAPATLKGEAYVASNQLRSNLAKGTSGNVCSELIYGNWRELLIGMWGVMEIAVNPYDSTGFKTGDVILRVMQTVDVGVRHGASFAVMSDALTPGF